MNMEFLRRLPIPQEVKAQYPPTEEDVKTRERQIRRIERIFHGESDRFLLVIGPCSADNPDAVLSYTEKLKRLFEEVEQKIEIIPRVYTNKPRTTGEGYKGILHQPDPEERPDLLSGIIASRTLHLRVLHDYGFGCADEMLYPENHRFLSDLLAYAAVGARSVENQQHRLTASGLAIPVGMKNPTGGNLRFLVNSIHAAQCRHTFLYRNWEVRTAGNPLTHAILRGYTDLSGKTVPNYDRRSLETLYGLFSEEEILNPAVIIDTNHSNTDKNCFLQAQIAKTVVQYRKDPAHRRYLKGLMIESYLEDGSQKIGCHTFGQSITDPCLGWEKTERLVREIAELL